MLMMKDSQIRGEKLSPISVILPPDSTGLPHCRDSYKSIDDTRKPYPYGYGKPLELVFGKKFQLPIFERCLETMLVDEVFLYHFDFYMRPVIFD